MVSEMPTSSLICPRGARRNHASRTPMIAQRIAVKKMGG